MKAIDLAVNNILPPSLRRPDRVYDKHSLDILLAETARDFPNEYPRVLKELSDLGRHSAYLQGETLKLDDFRPVLDRDAALARMDQEVAQSDRKSKNPVEAHRNKLDIWARTAENLEKATASEALRQGNNLGNTVVSGARGNPLQLKALITTPGLYTDYKDNIIPMFMRHSFGEGLRPAEYLASSYGTRRSVIQTKAATAQFGDILKQWNAAAAPIMVTSDDCGTSNGLDMGVDEPDIHGRVLAKGYGNLKAGDVLNRREIGELRKSGLKKVIVRSPMTCQAKEGICAHCLGQLPTGHFAKKGYAAGITAGAALGEPLVQGSLHCLADGTLVRMTGGCVKSIEKIKVGDWVGGCDLQGNLFPVEVTATWDQGLQPCQRYYYGVSAGGIISLASTKEHRVMGEGEKGYEKFKIGDTKNITLPIQAFRKGKLARIEDIGLVHCHDITVDHPDNLFVLENGIVVENSKHTGGGFKGTKKQFTGYGVIRQLIQSPETFPHKAPVAEMPGRVESIDDAPQGGKFITVEGKKHYALPGYDPIIKPGDMVEAGDQLSEGIVDVADIVRLRGIGEGRKYYVERLKQALEESGGGKIGRTNLEIMARASLDHARVESPDGIGDLLPDDIGSYNHLSANYSPPKDTKLVPVDHSHGKFLQSPVLHFSIGTKLTPKMASQIKDAGVSHVPVSDTEPSFVPEMVRLRAVTHNNPDWFARMHGSYLGTNLQESALRSRDTDTNSNIHFAPRLAKGEHFGEKLEQTGKF